MVNTSPRRNRYISPCTTPAGQRNTSRSIITHRRRDRLFVCSYMRVEYKSGEKRQSDARGQDCTLARKGVREAVVCLASCSRERGRMARSYEMVAIIPEKRWFTFQQKFFPNTVRSDTQDSAHLCELLGAQNLIAPAVQKRLR